MLTSFETFSNWCYKSSPNKTKELFILLTESRIWRRGYWSRSVIHQRIPLFCTMFLLAKMWAWKKVWISFCLNIWIWALEDFEAWHPLGKPKGIYPAPIKIKIVFFKMKNEVYFRTTLLAGSTNFLNRRPTFIKERLIKFDRDFQTEASELNLVTTSRNSEFRVFVKSQTIKQTLLESNVEGLGSTSGST